MSKNESRINKLEKNQASKAPASTRIPRDPVAFARLLDIVPDPWQCDLLTSSHKRIILNCARQSGKSTIVAILALHHALLNPGALVAVVSPSQRQSTELLRKVSDFYRQLGQPGGSVADSATTLELRNGSRIIALPGSEPSIRGFTASLVLIDEAAQVSEEIYRSIRPSLAVSGGRLTLLSTPRGKRGIFWRAWDQEPNWKKVKVTADQCPRITKEFLDDERRALGPSVCPRRTFASSYKKKAASLRKNGFSFTTPPCCLTGIPSSNRGILRERNRPHQITWSGRCGPVSVQTSTC